MKKTIKLIVYLICLMHICNKDNIHDSNIVHKSLFFNNCNIVQSKLIYLFISQLSTILKLQIQENKSLDQLLKFVSEHEKFNNGLYGSFKCDLCTKTFSKKDYTLLHKILFHGLDKQTICLADYCNIYHCNKIKQYIKLQPKYIHSTDTDLSSYTLINQREQFCDRRLISNYKQMCLIHLKNNKNRYSYCSKLTCNQNFKLPSNTLDIGLQFLKTILGILIGVLVFIYLAIIWLNRFF